MVRSSFKERLLSEDEWRHIGIVQSLGWEHYLIHGPEPHIFLFRRVLEEEEEEEEEVPVPKKEIKKHPKRQALKPPRRQALKETQAAVPKPASRKRMTNKKENSDAMGISKHEEEERCTKKSKKSQGALPKDLDRRKSTTVANSDQEDKHGQRRRSQRLSSVSLASIHRK